MTRVRLVVPTSRSAAPDCRITSGTRNPPPISTSSPREITTSRPGASARQDQHGRGGVVVDDDRGLGAGDRGEQRLGVHRARAARARREVVFEIGVAARDRGDALDRRVRQRRAAEVGVNHDAGGVDDRPQRSARLDRQRAARRALRSRPPRLRDVFAGRDPRAERVGARPAARRPSRRRRAALRARARRRAAASMSMLGMILKSGTQLEIITFGTAWNALAPLEPLAPFEYDLVPCPATRKYRPVERYWPYVEKPEEPTAEELAALDPDLHATLFGPRELPFSITLVFPPFDGENYERALEKAQGVARNTSRPARARTAAIARGFFPATRCALRDLFELVGPVPGTEVLIDDRPDARTRASCGCRCSGFTCCTDRAWRRPNPTSTAR